jgi:hypothetical protein
MTRRKGSRHVEQRDSLGDEAEAAGRCGRLHCPIRMEIKKSSECSLCPPSLLERIVGPILTILHTDYVLIW